MREPELAQLLRDHGDSRVFRAVVYNKGALVLHMLRAILGDGIFFKALGHFLHRYAFDVVDTGIGMNPEQLGNLFNAFSQADASITRRFGGTGLGLAIVKSIVESCGGRVGVESAPGKGATFWFTVPFMTPVKRAEGLA